MLYARVCEHPFEVALAHYEDSGNSDGEYPQNYHQAVTELGQR